MALRFDCASRMAKNSSLAMSWAPLILRLAASAGPALRCCCASHQVSPLEQSNSGLLRLHTGGL